MQVKKVIRVKAEALIKDLLEGASHHSPRQKMKPFISMIE